MSLFAKKTKFMRVLIWDLADGHFSVIPDMLVRNNMLYLEWSEVRDRSEIGFSFLLVGFFSFFALQTYTVCTTLPYLQGVRATVCRNNNQNAQCKTCNRMKKPHNRFNFLHCVSVVIS